MPTRMMADYEGNLVRLRQKSEALAKAALRNEELLLELLKQTKGITRCPPSQGEAGTSAFWGWNNSFQKNGRLLLCRKNAG